MAIYYQTQNTKIGPVTIAADSANIVSLQFGPSDSAGLPKPPHAAQFSETGWLPGSTPLIDRAFSQLAEYLDGRRTSFDLPLSPSGTAFQKKIWSILQTIPYGETRSYGQIAALAGNPNASRAVGMANHYNPIAIFIPCHRVIGKNGSLTGFAGGLDVKQTLLALEHAIDFSSVQL